MAQKHLSILRKRQHFATVVMIAKFNRFRGERTCILLVVGIIFSSIVLAAVITTGMLRIPLSKHTSHNLSEESVFAGKINSKMASNHDGCKYDLNLCSSHRDDRTFHFVSLPNNQLRVVLISDPVESQPAVSMGVSTGHFDDPPDYPGLAHFCEHMLFLGTKKYPQVNTYSNFVITHGGRENAHTNSEQTVFKFQISSYNYLEQSLDMFAQFFISPLFNEEFIQREIDVVDQEYQNKLHEDKTRLFNLIKHVSNREHPYHKFGTGNRKSLDKKDVREKLLQFYRSKYSASTVSCTKGVICTIIDSLFGYSIWLTGICTHINVHSILIFFILFS